MDNDVLIPEHLKDHNYYILVDNYFTLDQQYADDIGWASTRIKI